MAGKAKFVPMTSPQQIFLYSRIKSVYPDAKLNFKIRTDKNKYRYADVALVINGIDRKKIRLVIEYDGFYHRFRQKQDAERDAELARIGWKTIRINKYNKDEALDIIAREIEQCQ